MQHWDLPEKEQWNQQSINLSQKRKKIADSQIYCEIHSQFTCQLIQEEMCKYIFVQLKKDFTLKTNDKNCVADFRN